MDFSKWEQTIFKDDESLKSFIGEFLQDDETEVLSVSSVHWNSATMIVEYWFKVNGTPVINTDEVLEVFKPVQTTSRFSINWWLEYLESKN